MRSYDTLGLLHLQHRRTTVKQTYDCTPTLNDEQVIEFCKQGFLLLENVIDDDINQLTNEFFKEHTELSPIELLSEKWFIEGVIKNPQAAGAVRSLLGKDFGLPIGISNHRNTTQLPAQEWHWDSNSKFGPQVDYLQVFYLPQACTREMGPTELIPGSHFIFSHRDAMHSIGHVKGSYYATLPAGSVLITHYGIWHRRSKSTVSKTRNNVKYSYWRTSPPKRDWIITPDFDATTVDYSLHKQVIPGISPPDPTYRQKNWDQRDAAEMYFWLRGESDKFQWIGGGGSWPTQTSGTVVDSPYGSPRI